MAIDVKGSDSGDKLTSPVVMLVDPVADVGLALVERGSINNTINEENNTFEAHGQTDNIVNPTTQEGEVSMTLSRMVDDAGLEHLGIRDDLNEGKYIRGEGREFEALELWKFEQDVDSPADADVTQRDRLENARVDVDDFDLGDETETFDIMIHYEAVNDLYLGYEPDAV